MDNTSRISPISICNVLNFQPYFILSQEKLPILIREFLEFHAKQNFIFFGKINSRIFSQHRNWDTAESSVNTEMDRLSQKLTISHFREQIVASSSQCNQSKIYLCQNSKSKYFVREKVLKSLKFVLQVVGTSCFSAKLGSNVWARSRRGAACQLFVLHCMKNCIYGFGRRFSFFILRSRRSIT